MTVTTYYFEGNHLSLKVTDPHDSRIIQQLKDYSAATGESKKRLGQIINRLVGGTSWEMIAKPEASQ